MAAHQATQPVERLLLPKSGTGNHDHEIGKDHDGQEPPKQEPTTSRIKNSGPIRQWWSEACSCLVMIATFVALVCVLYTRQGSTLREWSLSLTINTVISILSTIIKTCALLIHAEGLSQLKWQWFRQARPLHDLKVFDAASRGPWGCVKFLLSLKFTHLVGTTGAFLTILTLALDPFTQQLLRFDDCQTLSTKAQATVPRSSFYRETGNYVGSGDFKIATEMLAYIYQGLYRPNDVKSTFNCPSGNCTFDDTYSTIAYCALCEDLSDLVTVTNQTMENSGEWYLNTSISGSRTYALAGPGITNSSLFEIQYRKEIESPGYFEFISTVYPGWSDTSKCEGPEADRWACNPQGAGAAWCEMFPCVKTYNGTVRGHDLQEELVSNYTDLYVSTGTVFFVAADLDCAGEEVRKELIDLGFDVAGKKFIPWNVNVEDSYHNGTLQLLPNSNPYELSTPVPGPLLNSSQLDIIPPTCIFSMKNSPVVSLRNFFYDTLPSKVYTVNGSPGYEGNSEIRAIYNDSNVNFASINYTFHKIAEAITVRMREFQDPTQADLTQPAIGRVWDEDRCVGVRWGYSAFPASLVLLTTMFLVLVIVHTSFGRMGGLARGWKSSPIPLILPGLDLGDTGVGGDREMEASGGSSSAMSIWELDARARLTRARLRIHDGDDHLAGNT